MIIYIITCVLLLTIALAIYLSEGYKDHIEEAPAEEKPEDPEEKAEPTSSWHKADPISSWHMEPEATIIIRLQLDKMPASQARGSLLQMDDIIKGWYIRQGMEEEKAKKKLLLPEGFRAGRRR